MARNLLGDPRMLQIAFPSRFAKDGINRVRIILEANDLYTVEFWSVLNLKMRCVHAVNDVPAEALRAVFTRYTGLDCTL